MEKLLRRIAIVALLGLCIPSIVSAQDNPTRVTILTFFNDTTDERYAEVCRNMTDTIALTVRLLPQFEYVAWSPSRSSRASHRDGGSTGGLSTVPLDEIDVDRVIGGRVHTTADDRVLAEITVIDGTTGAEIVREEREIAFLLDTFATADVLIAAVFEALGSGSVSWGTLEITSKNSYDVNYTVTIDAIDVGRNVDAVERVVAGERTVQVLHERPLGTMVLEETVVDIEPNRTVEVAFRSPNITDMERDAFRALDTEVRARLRKKPKTAEPILEAALALLETHHDTPALNRYYDRFQILDRVRINADGPIDLPSEEIREADVLRDDPRMPVDYFGLSGGFGFGIPVGEFADLLSFAYFPVFTGDYVFVRDWGELGVGLLVGGIGQPTQDKDAYEGMLISSPLAAHVLYRTGGMDRRFLFAELSLGGTFNGMWYYGDDAPETGPGVQVQPFIAPAAGGGIYFSPKFGASIVAAFHTTVMADGFLFNIMPGLRAEYVY